MLLSTGNCTSRKLYRTVTNMTNSSTRRYWSACY